MTHGQLTNRELYSSVAQSAGLTEAQMAEKMPIGRAGAMRSPAQRAVRFVQQTLKAMGVLERVEGERGVWRVAVPEGKKGLHAPPDELTVLAFQTDLGAAIWGNSPTGWRGFDEEVSLVFSSPPFPLRNARAYGNVDEQQYVDWLCRALEPLIRTLVPGGSVVLNLSNDIHLPRSPARSLYLERLIIALHDRLGLSKMDAIPWVNLSKAPGPTYWACVNRVQMAAKYEPVYWMTNDPLRVRSDNRRILQPHSEKHKRLIAAGGEQRTAVFGDGAYRISHGSFGAPTEGRLPHNVLMHGHNCPDSRAYRRAAKNMGLPVHAAMMPSVVAEWAIRFLTEPGELVVDLFGGTARTGLVAERLKRRWFVMERILQYLRGGAELFAGAPGYRLSEAFRTAFPEALSVTAQC